MVAAWPRVASEPLNPAAGREHDLAGLGGGVTLPVAAHQPVHERRQRAGGDVADLAVELLFPRRRVALKAVHQILLRHPLDTRRSGQQRPVHLGRQEVVSHVRDSALDAALGEVGSQTGGQVVGVAHDFLDRKVAPLDRLEVRVVGPQHVQFGFVAGVQEKRCERLADPELRLFLTDVVRGVVGEVPDVAGAVVASACALPDDGGVIAAALHLRVHAGPSGLVLILWEVHALAPIVGNSGAGGV